jgi:hypothetical protein
MRRLDQQGEATVGTDLDAMEHGPQGFNRHIQRRAVLSGCNALDQTNAMGYFRVENGRN